MIEAIAAALPTGARLYRWDAGGDNPYHALLGLADRFVVTGDSISMMVEVARLGKPLAIFALPASGSLAAAAQRPRPAPGRGRGPPGRPARFARRRALPPAHRQVCARPVGNPPPSVCARARRPARATIPVAADASIGRSGPSGRARPAADVAAGRLTPSRPRLLPATAGLRLGPKRRRAIDAPGRAPQYAGPAGQFVSR